MLSLSDWGMNDEDFIEDSYLDASAENGSHTISPQPSSYFAIDSDNGSDEDGKINIEGHLGRQIYGVL